MKRTLVQRTPVYYGWVVWAVATIGFITASPAMSFSASLFIDYFIEDFGLSRTSVSTLYGVATFIGAFALIVIGKWIDTRGNRLMTVIITACFGLALFSVSLAQGAFSLFVGFALLRTFGAGALTMVNTTTIAQWFSLRRGVMISLTLAAYSLFKSGYVPFVEELLSQYDWREIWQFMGFGVLAFILPLLWLFLRDRPEDHGLHPDNLSTQECRMQINEHQWTLRQARRTALFKVFMIGRAIVPMLVSGLLLHQMSIFSEQGFDRATTATAFAGASLVATVVALVAGYLLDRVQPKWVMSGQLLSLIATLVLAMTVTSTWMLALYAIAFGVVIGSGMVFDGSVWANVFGREHLGEIRGFIKTSNIVGAAIGPVGFGLSYDQLGSYLPMMVVAIAMAAVTMILAIRVQDPVYDNYAHLEA
jgi:sugar phosphate permease